MEEIRHDMNGETVQTEPREEPVAENTTVNRQEIMREIYARVYRGALLCHVLLIAGGILFLLYKPVVTLVSRGQYVLKPTAVEIVVGAVVAAAGVLGVVSTLVNVRKEASKASDEDRTVRAYFYRDRIEVENGERFSSLKLDRLSKTRELKHSLLFYFKHGSATEIFFADREGFTKPDAVEKLRKIPAYRLKRK